jgi:rare lipoprotein A
MPADGLARPGAARRRGAWPLLAAALVAGCAGGPAQRDGPGAAPPPGLDRVPDAVPRVEPLRVGGPNKPYTARGRRYVPLAVDAPMRETGGASWYGRKFHGRPTALGEAYDMYAMTAAHKTMPLPSYARVRDPATGREIVVRVNDRGPFVDGRVIDLSYTAALRLGVLRGVTPVEVERITHAQIRADRWRRDEAPAAPFDGPGWWLQLGAFRDPAGAAQLLRLLRAEAGWLATRERTGGGWSRVQAGPFGSRADAASAAARLSDALPLDALLIAPR